MILLDTNVLAAAMLDVPVPEVVAWLDRQPRGRVWTSVVTVFEIEEGPARRAESRQTRALMAAYALLRTRLLGDRIAALDEAAASRAALLAARRRRRGRTVNLRDTLIGGIAVARGATLATRNTRHFDDLEGVVVVDPRAERGG